MNATLQLLMLGNTCVAGTVDEFVPPEPAEGLLNLDDTPLLNLDGTPLLNLDE